MKVLVGAILAVAIGIASCSSEGFGQSTSTLAGYVLDPTGAAVPKAEVVVTVPATGFSRTDVTSDLGFYSFAGLNPGIYSLTVHAKTFQAAEKTGIKLDVDQQISVNVNLEVGSATQTVTVSATAVQLETENAVHDTVIGASQVADLGVNGRNFPTLAFLVPGVNGTLSVSDGSLDPKTMEINGISVGNTSWSVDNVQDLEPKSAQDLEANPAMAAVGQFNVQTSNFSAAYGTQGAAVVDVSILSGTNQFHGQAYDWLRNSAMNALQYFSTEVPPDKENDFGATLGGPLKRNKLFFFYSQEWRRFVNSDSFNEHTPSALERAGNFSQSPLASNAKTLLDPTGMGCVTGTQVLPSCFAPNAVAVLQAGLFPSPTSTGSAFDNYAAFPSYTTNFHQELVRMDYNLTAKTTLTGHFINQNIVILNPRSDAGGGLGAQSFPTIGSNDVSPAKSILLRATHAFSSKFLSVSDLTYSSWGQDGGLIGHYAIPPGFDAPLLFPASNNAENRIPTLALSQSYGTLTTDGYPRVETIRTYHAQEGFTLERGRHTLDFGLLWQDSQTLKQNSNIGTEGGFTFTGQFTNNAFADFLLGYAAEFQEDRAQLEDDFYQKMFASFFQDNFRPSRALTLNFGLRWSIMPHAFDGHGETSNFEPTFFSASAAEQLNSSGNIIPGIGNPTNGIVLAGQGVPKSFVPTSWDIVDPRIGFAFVPQRAPKIVIRGGYGIYHAEDAEDDSLSMILNPPFGLTVERNDALFGNPSAGLTPASVPVSLNALDFHYPIQTIQEYSLGIQQALPDSVLLDINYVGSDSNHLENSRQLNQPLPIPGYDFNPVLNLASTQVNLYRPYQGYAGINLSTNAATSSYNGLQVSLRRNLQGNYYYGASYSYSKTLGDQSLQDSYNPHADYGPTGYDQRDLFTAYFLVHPPFFRNSHSVAGKTLGGWNLSGIVSAYTGLAETISITGGGLGLATRPNVTGPIKYEKTLAKWFSADYSKPAAGFFGDSSVGSVHGPGSQRWDLSLLKSFGIFERIHAQFRVDAFDAFNHANFTSFVSSYGSGNFGAVTGSAAPRQLQLGLQILY